MEKLIIYETDRGRYSVRPMNWAGIWNEKGQIKESLNHLALFIKKEDAEKFVEWKTAEEQGKLLKLPCKPEDKLYWISDQDEDSEFTYEPIEEVEICNIDYNGYSLQLWFADKGVKEFPVLAVSSIGKELFYTQEEAEAALKEMSE